MRRGSAAIGRSGFGGHPQPSVASVARARPTQRGLAINNKQRDGLGANNEQTQINNKHALRTTILLGPSGAM